MVLCLALILTCGGKTPAQTLTMRVNYNGSVDLPDPSPGPTDDGYIAVAVKSVPQDPLCCTGLNVTDGEIYFLRVFCHPGILLPLCEGHARPQLHLFPPSPAVPSSRHPGSPQTRRSLQPEGCMCQNLHLEDAAAVANPPGAWRVLLLFSVLLHWQARCGVQAMQGSPQVLM
jgi:hypothetical protein